MLACIEIAREDGALHAWFLAGDIRAGTPFDPESSLSVDAMVTEHRPKMPDDPDRLFDGHVFILLAEKEMWYAWKRCRGALAY